MTNPVAISADLEAGAILVRYRHLPDGTRIDHDDRIALGATAGVDSNGKVVSIELLSVEDETLAAAADYAHTRQLAFPLALSHLLDAA
jgi:hypothetical protein